MNVYEVTITTFDDVFYDECVLADSKRLALLNAMAYYKIAVSDVVHIEILPIEDGEDTAHPERLHTDDA